MMKRLLIVFAVLLMVLPACAPLDEDKEPKFEETLPVINLVLPIDITDTTNSDKVVTEVNFTMPQKLKEDTYNEHFKLPKLISSNMLLQANMPVRVWGGYDKDVSIAVRVIDSLDNIRSFYGKAKNQNFEIYIGATDYGGPYTIEIISEDGNKKTIRDVLFGELYLGGGQSNMGWTMSQCYDGKTNKLLFEDEIKNSKNNDIRLYSIAPDYNDEELEDFSYSASGGWVKAGPGTVMNFSAAAYFFAREINMQYGVPVGVIVSCMGGTGIYTWMPDSEYQTANGLYLKDDNYKDGSKYYNAMIYPLRKMVLRGVIWYQGEGQNKNYANNLKLLIEGWRRVFEKDNLYFATVQLPRMPDETEYYLCREEHKKIAGMLDYVTYSVNIDTGLLEANIAEGDTLNQGGIHPYDKDVIGIRLAHSIMDKFYGAKGVWRGPTLKSYKVYDDFIELEFENVGSGLILTADLSGFEIKDGGKKYAVIKPELISYNKVKLSTLGINKPNAVRYGYKNNTTFLDYFNSYSQSVSLYNTIGAEKEKAYPAEQFLISINAD